MHVQQAIQYAPLGPALNGEMQERWSFRRGVGFGFGFGFGLFALPTPDSEYYRPGDDIVRPKAPLGRDCVGQKWQKNLLRHRLED